MSYTVTLELPDGAMTLADRGDGDRPRQAPCAPDQPKTTSYVAGSGFIGGADGPASAFVGEEQGKLRMACSLLRFGGECGIADDFPRKQFEDMTLEWTPSNEAKRSISGR